MEKFNDNNKVNRVNKIVLSGYYGFHNAGDEAILYSIINQLRKLAPDLELVVLSNDPEHTRRTFGVEAVNRWQLPAVVKAIKGAGLLISGGGSLLQDVTGSKSIVYYLGVVGIAQTLGVPTFFYSQGIGPVAGGLGRRLIPLVANRTSALTVRDLASARLLTELGVTKEVKVTADPVLGVKREWVDLSIGKKLLFGEANEASRGRIGLALRNWKYMDRALPALAQWGKQMVNEGWQLVLLPFHMPEDRDYSREFIKELMKTGNFSEGSCVLLGEGYTTNEYLSIIGNLDLMISLRLHGLIMAAVMEVPLTGISYDPKVDVFLDQVDQPLAAKLDDSLDEAQLMVSLTNSLEQRQGLQQQLQRRLPQLQEQATEAARLALETYQLKNAK